MPALRIQPSLRSPRSIDFARARFSDPLAPDPASEFVARRRRLFECHCASFEFCGAPRPRPTCNPYGANGRERALSVPGDGKWELGWACHFRVFDRHRLGGGHFYRAHFIVGTTHGFTFTSPSAEFRTRTRFSRNRNCFAFAIFSGAGPRPLPVLTRLVPLPVPPPLIVRACLVTAAAAANTSTCFPSLSET